jgi:AraC-like DNA-binding protein
LSYRIDLFAAFIFLGIIQAIFLSFFFLSKENRKSHANVFQGLMLIVVACCILEIFMMYTGYIIHAFYLVDFSESLAFLIGPFFYFTVISLTRGKVDRMEYLHLLPFVIYTFCLTPFLVLPEDAKYNAWISSYQPGLPFRAYDYPYDANPLSIRNYATQLTLLSIFTYTLIGLFEIVKAFQKKKESFWKPLTPALVRLRSLALMLLSVALIILIVKLSNKRDMGDHVFATYIALTIYFTSFSVIINSSFFKQTTLTEAIKYKASSLTPELQVMTLKKLEQLMKNEKPFLRPDFSLPDLANKLHVSVHTLSQAINDGLSKSFFEMLAEYRVEEAKRFLREQPNIKIEDIAEQVGYNSKSSFNTAFKKITGKTPSEFRSI